MTEDSDVNETSLVACFRRQWWFSNLKPDQKHRWADMEAIFSPRQCPYFIKYEPSCTPEEHKTLQRESRTNNTIRNATILGAVIGAVIGGIIAIASQLVFLSRG